MVDKKYIFSALNGDNLIIKCRPKTVSKPTSKDEKFIASFFGDDNAEDTRWETYWENYFRTDTDKLNSDTYNDDYDEAMKNISFTDEELKVRSDWSSQGYNDINYYAYHHNDKGFNKNNFFTDKKLEELDKKVKLLDGMIKNTPNNPRNTHMFRIGFEPFDKLEVGEVYTQEGFASLTYSEVLVDVSIESAKPLSYMGYEDTPLKIDYYVPENTQGLYVAKDYEDEYLTGPGTRYYCFYKDLNKGQAKVVILP